MAVVLVEGDEELASLVEQNTTTVPGRSAATSVGGHVWSNWWILLAYIVTIMNV